jgi:benzodiazapine receptor
MAGIASKSQLRMSFLRYALVTVPALLLLGTLSGAMSGSGSGNFWFRMLHKPPLMPPAWVFGAVWTCLYVLLGLSLAMILHAHGAKNRQKAVGLYGVGLILNLAWSPIFFAFHKVEVALSVIAAMLVVTLVTILIAWRIRVIAGLLLYPYLAWLMFAGLLNYQVLELNPNADALAPGRVSTDIPL